MARVWLMDLVRCGRTEAPKVRGRSESGECSEQLHIIQIRKLLLLAYSVCFVLTASILTASILTAFILTAFIHSRICVHPPTHRCSATNDVGADLIALILPNNFDRHIVIVVLGLKNYMK